MASAYTSLLSFLLGFFVIALLGAMIARPLSGASPRPFHLILGATAAIAVYSLLMTIVGMAGGLRYSFAVTLAAFFVVAAWYIAYTIRWGGHKRGKFDWSSWRPQDAPTTILVVLLILFQLLMLLNALAPYINPDAEISHYLFIRNYIESGQISILPQNAFSYYPQALELSVLTAFAHAGDHGPDAANLCFWFMQLLLMGWIVDFCVQRGKARVGWLLAAATSGLFYWPVIAYSGYIDGGVTLFSLAGTFTYFGWLLSRDRPSEGRPDPRQPLFAFFSRLRKSGFTSLALVGLFLGTACASKYSALPLAALIFLHILWILASDRIRRKTTLATFIGFLVFFLIPVIPWYGRNILATGNPVFPFLRGIFGGPELTLADDVGTWATWGIPVTITNYFIYPLKLSWFYQFGNSWLRVPYLYMSWLFALAPIAGILLLHRRLERIVAIWCFVFFSFAFFVMSLQTRYFLPFTILALWLVVEWLDALFRAKSNWARWVVFIIVVVPFLFQMNVAWGHFIQRVPYLTGKLTRAQFIDRIWPTAEVFREANEVATADNTLMIFSLRTYNVSAPYVIPSGGDFDPRLTAAQMLSRLEQQQIGYLLMETRMRRGAALIEWCVTTGETQGRFTVFDENEMIAAMRERDVSRGLAREILRHRGGEKYTDPSGSPRWRIDLSQFSEPEVIGILRFLANVNKMESEGDLTGLTDVRDIDPVRQDDWELYEIRSPN